MSAEVLREAASLMRERAEAATGAPWSPILVEDEDGSADSYVISLTGLTSIGEDVGESMTGQDAEHIASWHPAVALAVADWLKSVAADVDKRDNPKRVGGRFEAIRIPDENAAFRVATTYLGSAS